jgi:hypothetical protein
MFRGVFVECVSNPRVLQRLQTLESPSLTHPSTHSSSRSLPLSLSQAFEHGVNRVVIRERKGIIKYALEHGYSLQLIYTFGECRSYHSLFSGLKRLRMWINRHQIPAVAFFGDPLVPIFPRRDVPCLSYVAPPMQLPHIEAPTEAQVEEWHARYVAALQSHFEASKAHAGEPDALREVW